MGLPNLADGTYPPADQWELSVQNTRSTPATMRVSAFCFAAPEARLLVSSTSLAPGETRGFDVSIPINWTLLGGGIATGRSANMFGSAAWRVGFGYSFMRSANIGAPPPGGAFMTMVTDTRTPGSSSTAPPVRQGAIVIPSNIATVPVTTATVREFVYPGGHSQGLSWLYFMTSNPQEQTDLMTGVHPGWNSTGRSFNWYAAGSGGPIDRRPFCRYYELMGASHFFSNNPYECALVLDKFSDHWGLESGEVGQVQVPDATTGMCPSNTVPVMRFWNGGQPIGPGGAIVQNHEYVISPSVASQRTMEHWISEGVVFCAQ